MFSKKNKKEVYIEGMVCSHCAKKVEDSLSELEGVEKVKVNLDKKCATITYKDRLDDNDIKTTINNLDYKVTDIVEK